jgi:hypothetical protein
MNQSFWKKAQALDRRIIYLVLVVCVTLGLYIPGEIPNKKPDPSSTALYQQLTNFDLNRPVFVQSDWTNSTRGENAGHLEALLRILIARKQKFAIFSLADPQAPQVARNVLAAVNKELPKEQRLVKGVDYLDLGFFPNAEGTTQAMAINLRNAWGTRVITMPDRSRRNIFDTEVLKGVNRIQDIAAMVYVTASNTVDVGIQRLSGKVPLLCMCTGVVGPQMLPYFREGQLSGLAIGLKGVYDIETIMAYGVNHVADGKTEATIADPAFDGVIQPMEGYVHEGRGKKYIAALNVALALMIFAVVFGNIAMAMAKAQEKGESAS